MSQTLIAVTGASGNIGRELVRLLLDRGHRVRAIARNEKGLEPLRKSGAEVAPGPIEDVEFLSRALAGASAAFTMVPPNHTAPDFRSWQNRAADALASGLDRAKVGRVVNLSSLGADLPGGTGPIAGLHDAEERLNRLTASVVHLRPTFFLENHLQSIGLIKAQGVNGGALDPGVRLPMIATRDIARVAADILTGPAFAGKSVRELLGAADHDMPAVTRALGQAIDRPDLAYVRFPDEGVRQALLATGMSPDLARLMLEMMAAMNAGQIRSTMGRSAASTTPTTLEQFAREVFAPAYRAA